MGCSDLKMVRISKFGAKETVCTSFCYNINVFCKKLSFLLKKYFHMTGENLPLLLSSNNISTFHNKKEKFQTLPFWFVFCSGSDILKFVRNDYWLSHLGEIFSIDSRQISAGFSQIVLAPTHPPVSHPPTSTHHPRADSSHNWPTHSSKSWKMY